MITHELLKNARANLRKTAFQPMTPEAMAAAQGGMPQPAGGAMPPMPPDAMAMGGMPQGAMPPMPPMMPPGAVPPPPPTPPQGAPPMDPSMGGMPPMDPAMMAMAAGAPPADPAAAMQGMPPEAAAAMQGTPVTLTLEDLQTVVSQLAGASQDKQEEGRITNKEIMAKLEDMEQALAGLLQAIGGPAQVGTAPAPEPPMPPPAPMPPMPDGSQMKMAAQGNGRLARVLAQMRRNGI